LLKSIPESLRVMPFDIIVMSKLYVFALMTAYSSGANAQEIFRHQVDKTAIYVNAGQVAYETGNKENNIWLRDQNISLLKQNRRLQQALSDEAVRLRNETIAGILILLFCGGIFYRQYWLKHQSSRLVSQKNKIITEKNELVDRLNKEKELLLSEVHHRVKNNLYTILSLLESQSIFLENEAYKALEDSRSRVYAMLLIHQQLYRTEDINMVNMAIYLSEFVSYLQQSLDAHKIHFELIALPIQLSLSQAMPLALIINEAVTNSIKYAFPKKRNGEIKINLSRQDQLIKLVIADNGIGIDLGLLDIPLNSLGITLIRGLTEDIKGSLLFESDNGTCVTLHFNIDYFYHSPVLGSSE